MLLVLLVVVVVVLMVVMSGVVVVVCDGGDECGGGGGGGSVECGVSGVGDGVAVQEEGRKEGRRRDEARLREGGKSYRTSFLLVAGTYQGTSHTQYTEGVLLTGSPYFLPSFLIYYSCFLSYSPVSSSTSYFSLLYLLSPSLSFSLPF